MLYPIRCEDCDKKIWVTLEHIKKYKETGEYNLRICKACQFANMATELPSGTIENLNKG